MSRSLPLRLRKADAFETSSNRIEASSKLSSPSLSAYSFVSNLIAFSVLFSCDWLPRIVVRLSTNSRVLLRVPFLSSFSLTRFVRRRSSTSSSTSLGPTRPLPRFRTRLDEDARVEDSSRTEDSSRVEYDARLKDGGTWDSSIPDLAKLPVAVDSK